MVASCRGNLSFRRTARKATPIRLGDQAPGHVGWGRVGPAYICSSRKRWRSCSAFLMPRSWFVSFVRQCFR